MEQDEQEAARVDTFAPPPDTKDKDVARLRAYAEWLSKNANEAARNDGAALTRVLDRAEAAEQALVDAAARVDELQRVLKRIANGGFDRDYGPPGFTPIKNAEIRARAALSDQPAQPQPPQESRVTGDSLLPDRWHDPYCPVIANRDSPEEQPCICRGKPAGRKTVRADDLVTFTATRADMEQVCKMVAGTNYLEAGTPLLEHLHDAHTRRPAQSEPPHPVAEETPEIGSVREGEA
jgi:hypothetical protein